MNLFEIFLNLLYSNLTDTIAIFTGKPDDPNKEIEMDNTFDIEQQVMTVDKEMKELEEQKKKRKMISDQNNITLAEKNIKISKAIDEGDYNLDELIWLDPNPEINQTALMVDDVTQMNAKEVDQKLQQNQAGIVRDIKEDKMKGDISCTDELEIFVNCQLIAKNNKCHEKFYADICCLSCSVEQQQKHIMENIETLNHQHNSINFHKDEYEIEPESFHNSDI